MNLKKIVISVVLLCTITGCGNSTEGYSIPTPERIQNSSTSKMESLELSYKKVDIVNSLMELDPSQKWKTTMTKRINGAEIEIYHVRTDENLLAASLTIDSTNYGIGEIGYGNMEDFIIEIVDVLGENYTKIVGANGANSPVVDYVLLNPQSPLVLRLDAHTIEADVNGDGIKEIVSSVGTAAETTIYQLHDKQIVASNLNELMKAQVVNYDLNTNTFQAQSTNNELTKWKIQGDRLHLVE